MWLEWELTLILIPTILIIHLLTFPIYLFRSTGVIAVSGTLTACAPSCLWAVFSPAVFHVGLLPCITTVYASHSGRFYVVFSLFPSWWISGIVLSVPSVCIWCAVTRYCFVTDWWCGCVLCEQKQSGMEHILLCLYSYIEQSIIYLPVGPMSSFSKLEKQQTKNY